VLLSLGLLDSPHFRISVNKKFRYLPVKRTPPEKQRGARYSKLASASEKNDWPARVEKANQRAPALLRHLTKHKIDVFSPRCTSHDSEARNDKFRVSETHRES
jgi:hypothetical protein